MKRRICCQVLDCGDGVREVTALAVTAFWKHPHQKNCRGSRVSRLRRAVLVSMLCAPLVRAAETPSPIQLRDVSRQTGIGFVHTDGSSGRRYIVETVASGLATFDYDGDGLIDIYFVNGAPLQGTTTESKPQDRLYKNLGNWQFKDVTDAAGVGDTNYGLGATAGDF